MSAVFISYRRNDSSGHTGRLYDHLCEKFGQDVIFRDIDTIEPGTDFVEAVENNIKDCAALIVVIGTEWLTAEDEMGRRLDDPNDFVRIEVASALKKNIRVIPVLVKGATMPAGTNLPDDLAALSRRHALEISDSRWEYDMGRLITTLSGIINAEDEKLASQPLEEKPSDTETQTPPEVSAATIKTEKKTEPASRKKSGNSGLLLSLVGAALVIGFLVWQFLPDTEPTDNTKTEPEIAEPRSFEDRPDPSIKETELTEQINNEHEERVMELLSAAGKDLEKLRLTSPVGNNAFEKFNTILEMSPENQDAINGIKLIAEKYIGMAGNSLNKGDIRSAEKFLDQAITVYPQNRDIETMSKNILVEKQAMEEQRAQRQAEQQRLQAERNAQRARERAEAEKQAQIARERAEKEALLQREREAKQAMIQKEKAEACLKQCNAEYRRCQNTKTPDSTACESNATIECNKVQDACLGDPQTAILWGDLGADSECLGRYSRCMREKADECRAIIRDKTSDCEATFSACKRQCQN